eukprot:1044761-Prymnesium_polylepis.1
MCGWCPRALGAAVGHMRYGGCTGCVAFARQRLALSLPSRCDAAAGDGGGARVRGRAAEAAH